MSMSVRDLLQQRNKCKQCHDWARVSDLALNVPAIRFMGAHARGRVSCFSLAAHSLPESHLGGTVFQVATAALTGTKGYNARREPATARPANTAEGTIAGEEDSFEGLGSVIPRRTAESGASSATRICFPSAAIPKSFHIDVKSTSTAWSFHFAYRSPSTVVPAARSPILRASFNSQSCVMSPPAFRIPLNASCSPF